MPRTGAGGCDQPPRDVTDPKPCTAPEARTTQPPPLTAAIPTTASPPSEPVSCTVEPASPKGKTLPSSVASQYPPPDTVADTPTARTLGWRFARSPLWVADPKAHTWPAASASQ